jgi:tight adherence protein B
MAHEVIAGLLVMGSVLCGARAMHQARGEHLRRLIGSAVSGSGRPPFGPRLVDLWRALVMRTRSLQVLAGVLGALAGLRLAGPAGFVAGCAGGLSAPAWWSRRAGRRRLDALERQVGEAAEACALAVRTGLSIPNAFEVAMAEVEEPLGGIMAAAAAEMRLGASFEAALEAFAAAVGSEDSRLFALVLGIHHRSGGNVAAGLDEVTSTIRHRASVRRELRALSAQGRISGAILGGLPIGFFLVLAVSSRRELLPIYRSPVGVAMLSAGLLMEGLAYLWIRRLLRVEV